MILFERRAAAILYRLLRSLPGDLPFLLPANVCADVPLTFRAAGRPFSLMDIDPLELGLDRRQCVERVAAAPEAWEGVLYVRPYGAESRWADPLFPALRALRPGLTLVDDRCLCPPDPEGSSLVPEADLTLFSTGRAKAVDLGYGGFAHARDDLPYARGPLDPLEGREGRWLDLSSPPGDWGGYESEVRAARAAVEPHRARLSSIYAAGLPSAVQLPVEYQAWRFHIRVPGAERLVERLFQAGLFASRHYASLGEVSGPERYPQAERLHATIVNLFNDRNFDAERAERTVEQVLRHLDGEGWSGG